MQFLICVVHVKCIRCKDHALTSSYSCGPGFSFSMVAQGCMASSEMTCIETHCATTGNGFYIIPGTGCRAYYSCNQGKRTDYLCPLATTYDRSKQVRRTMLQLEIGNLQTPMFINLFMVYFTMLSTAQPVSEWVRKHMEGRIMAIFEILSWHFSGNYEENYKKTQSRHSISELRLECKTSQTWNHATHSTTMFSVWHFWENRAAKIKGKGKCDCFCASTLLIRMKR